MDKEKAARIDELLSYKNREYTINEQKAELLCRNEAFQKDCGKLADFFCVQHRLGRDSEGMLDRIKGKKDYPSEKEALAELGLKKMPKHEWFFEKWSMFSDWSGQKWNLEWSVYAGPKLCAISPWDKNPIPYDTRTVNGNSFLTAKELFRRDAYIIIDPWTTIGDIIKLCKDLPEIKKTCFGFSTESKGFFARDLCWYDLNTEMDLRPTRIAELWAKARPDDLRGLLLNSRDVRCEAKKLHVSPGDIDLDAFKDAYVVSNLPQAILAAVNRLGLMVRNLSKRPRSQKEAVNLLKNILRRKGFSTNPNARDEKREEWVGNEANEEEFKKLCEKEGVLWKQEEDS